MKIEETAATTNIVAAAISETLPVSFALRPVAPLVPRSTDASITPLT